MVVPVPACNASCLGWKLPEHLMASSQVWLLQLGFFTGTYLYYSCTSGSVTSSQLSKLVLGRLVRAGLLYDMTACR